MTSGSRLAKINSILHQEPWESIFYGIFWFIILFMVTPIAAACILIPLTIYRGVAWKLDWIGINEYDPKKQNIDKELAILVTGCDSGFGKEIALFASNAGFVVFAGCLQSESIAYFKGKNVESRTSRIIPIVMDVTSEEDVKKAFSQVAEWISSSPLAASDHANTKDSQNKQNIPLPRRVLHALVNNAGIAFNGPFDWMQVSDCEKIMNINYYGTLRCCKAALPILKRQSIQGIHKGCRIINITSVAGLMPGPAYSWNYFASKHAAQAFSEGLRQELSIFGIDVTTINPGFHQTPIVSNIQNAFKTLWNEKLSPKLRDEYGRDFLDALLTRAKKANAIAFPKHTVTNVVIETLKMRNAPAQRPVGMDAKYFAMLFRILPRWIMPRLSPKQATPAVMLKNVERKSNQKG